MKTARLGMHFLLVFVLLLTACKPGDAETQHQVVTTKPSLEPTDDSDPETEKSIGRAVLGYEQQSVIPGAFSQVTYADIPMIIYVDSDHPNKGEFLMEGKQSADVLMGFWPSGGFCAMGFTLGTTVVARGTFNPKTCSSSVYLSASADEVLERAGNCPPNIHALFTDESLLQHYIPPLAKSVTLKNTLTRYSFPVVKNTTMTLSLAITKYPGGTTCQFKSLP
jgi:hypothetical protein